MTVVDMIHRMKIRDIIQWLSELDQNADVCALVYTKQEFDYDDDDDVVLTDEAWAEICQGFDDQPFGDIVNSISMAVSDLAVDKELA